MKTKKKKRPQQKNKKNRATDLAPNFTENEDKMSKTGKVYEPKIGESNSQ
jgi:hypothetical protein